MALKYKFKPQEEAQNFVEFGRFNVQKKQRDTARTLMMRERVEPIIGYDLGDLYAPGPILLGDPLHPTDNIYYVARNGNYILIDGPSVEKAIQYEVILKGNNANRLLFANYDSTHIKITEVASVPTVLFGKPDDMFFYPKNGDYNDFRTKNTIFLDLALGTVIGKSKGRKDKNVFRYECNNYCYWKVLFRGRAAEMYDGSKYFIKLIKFDPNDPVDEAAGKHQAEQLAQEIRDEIIEKFMKDGAIE